MRLVIAVFIAATTSTAIAAPQAKVVVPEGWTEEKVPDEMLAPMAKVEGMLRVDAQLWRSPDGDMLSVLEQDFRDKGFTTRNIATSERGAEDSLKSLKPVSKTRKTVDHRVIIDAVYEGKAHVHMRRMYALDARGIVHTVFAQCGTTAGPSPTCNAALETVALQIDAVPIPIADASGGSDIVDKNSAAYRTGKVMGTLLVLGIFAYWFYRKKKPLPVAKVS